jgi:hypothetical protein
MAKLQGISIFCMYSKSKEPLINTVHTNRAWTLEM